MIFSPEWGGPMSAQAIGLGDRPKTCPQAPFGATLSIRSFAAPNHPAGRCGDTIYSDPGPGGAKQSRT